MVKKRSRDADISLKGYCKYKSRCTYFHPQHICQNHQHWIVNVKSVTWTCDDSGVDAHKEIAYKCEGCRVGWVKKLKNVTRNVIVKEVVYYALVNK